MKKGNQNPPKKLMVQQESCHEGYGSKFKTIDSYLVFK
jgi:hypothetical protein